MRTRGFPSHLTCCRSSHVLQVISRVAGHLTCCRSSHVLQVISRVAGHLTRCKWCVSVKRQQRASQQKWLINLGFDLCSCVGPGLYSSSITLRRISRFQSSVWTGQPCTVMPSSRTVL